MIKDIFSNVPVPSIRRARGYFLYTADGRRFLDFYQDEGRALLGHRVQGMQRVIKSTVSRGLLAPYPSVYGGRVERMVRKLFPSAGTVRVYRNKDRLSSAVAAACHKPASHVKIEDPLSHRRGEVMLWRPFLLDQPEDVPFLVPVFPFPGDFSPFAIVAADPGAELPPSDTVSPFLSDTLAKVISELSERLSAPPEDDLSCFDSSLWERRSRYLVFNMEQDAYRSLYIKALAAGIFLPPSADITGIIPLEYESGQVKKFLTLIKEAE